MSRPSSPAHFTAAVLFSLLSVRWLPFCVVGLHKERVIPEAFGRRRLCLRCGKTLEVGR